MRRFVWTLIAFGLAFCGMTAGTMRADASVVDAPTCVRVPLSDGQYRLYVDPGSVVKGDVREVRTRQTRLIERRDGTWVGTTSVGNQGDWRFVFKSNAKLFSERRYSSWVHCGVVRVR